MTLASVLHTLADLSTVAAYRGAMVAVLALAIVAAFVFFEWWWQS